MKSSRFNYGDQLSPSFTDSAVDFELSDHSSKSSVPDSHVVTLQDRLARLARLASENSRLPDNDSITVHQCLDTIESLLDPRPRLTREISKCRPQSVYSGTTASATSTTRPPAAIHCVLPAKDGIRSHLTVLLEEVTALDLQLKERRKESFRIYGLFNLKCQGLTQRIAELQGEIQELQADILEGSMELDGLRNTVRALETWVEIWEQRHALNVAKALEAASERTKRRRKDKGRVENADENDCDALIEGITAWMRGWRDVEEGFSIRARARRLRREARRKRRMSGTCKGEIFPHNSEEI